MLTLTDDKLLKFVLILGKSCVAFVWGEKLGCPRTLFIILLVKKFKILAFQVFRVVEYTGYLSCFIQREIHCASPIRILFVPLFGSESIPFGMI